MVEWRKRTALVLVASIWCIWLILFRNSNYNIELRIDALFLDKPFHRFGQNRIDIHFHLGHEMDFTNDTNQPDMSKRG
jgi:hypothetical protein